MADMTAVTAAVTAWVEAMAAQTDPPAAIRTVLADDVTAVLAMGEAAGAGDVATGLASAQLMQVLNGAAWSAPEVDGDCIRTGVSLPPGSVIGGMDVMFRVGDGGRVVEVEQALRPAVQAKVQPLALMGAVAEVLDGAMSSGLPVVMAYVDADLQPNMSLRGSVKVHSDDQLQIWVRNPEGGLLSALDTNDRLSFWFRNGAERATLQVKGRGRVVTDEALRRAVYDTTVEAERRADRNYRGVAVIVDVDTVDGRLPTGPVRMARSA
jgi:hypothetical protein